MLLKQSTGFHNVTFNLFDTVFPIRPVVIFSHFPIGQHNCEILSSNHVIFVPIRTYTIQQDWPKIIIIGVKLNVLILLGCANGGQSGCLLRWARIYIQAEHEAEASQS